MGIAENIASLRKEIPPHVRLIAVSKTMPVPAIMQAYNAGQRAFGENKVQELLQKQPLMPEDTEWHMIGHLQTNKVRSIIPFIRLIHSVDSLKLLIEIDKEAARVDRRIDCLLEMQIAKEETKYGLTVENAVAILSSEEMKLMNHIRITGVMGMATFTDDMNQVKKEFNDLVNCYNRFKAEYFANAGFFRELSIGMSGDYKAAIEAGSTMVRIGTLIFGERNYNR